MADTVRRVEYAYVTVPDTPGEGDRILGVLRERGVNLLAYLGFPLGGGQSQIDLVPEDPQSLREAAAGARITLSEAKQAFHAQGDDRVGAVADTPAKLAEASINVTAAAATSAGEGRYGMILWVAQADFERAAGALGLKLRCSPTRGGRAGAAPRRRLRLTIPSCVCCAASLRNAARLCLDPRQKVKTPLSP